MPAPEEKPKKKQDSFLVFLIKLVVIVLLFRTLLFTSFMIPSESMMPRLLVGDYLFAAKWPYGYSRRLDADRPQHRRRAACSAACRRGDVVIFKHPIDRTDYVKRVIGLPGDTVQMVAGVLHLNGEPVEGEDRRFRAPDRGRRGCRQARFAERAGRRQLRLPLPAVPRNAAERRQLQRARFRARARRTPPSRSSCPRASCS